MVVGVSADVVHHHQGLNVERMNMDPVLVLCVEGVSAFETI